MPDSRRRAESASGELVVLGGRRVHILDAPGRGPAIVLLGGCGVPSHRWEDVVRLLPGRRVVRLDRPGLEGTPWPGTLPTLGEEVATLAQLLARLEGRAVLVAHSMAGLHAEALVRTRPELVCALVLVDGSCEVRPRRPRSGALALLAGRVARRVGDAGGLRPLCVRAESLVMAAQSKRLRLFRARPAGVRPAATDGQALASIVAEQAAYGAQVWDLAALRRERPLPDIPVRVLSAGRGRWLRAQAVLADVLGGEHQVVDGSGHLMMIDRPDAVAAAARAVEG